VTLTVSSSTASITASPSRVAVGTTTSISWNVTGVQSCSLSKNGSIVNINGNSTTTLPGHTWIGTLLDTITTQTTYQIFCNNYPLTPPQYTTVTQIVNITNPFNAY
jgi:hypothetical protein